MKDGIGDAEKGENTEYIVKKSKKEMRQLE